MTTIIGTVYKTTSDRDPMPLFTVTVPAGKTSLIYVRVVAGDDAVPMNRHLVERRWICSDNGIDQYPQELSWVDDASLDIVITTPDAQNAPQDHQVHVVGNLNNVSWAVEYKLISTGSATLTEL